VSEARSVLSSVPVVLRDLPVRIDRHEVHPVLVGGEDVTLSPAMKGNLILVGFMGAGKSSVGRILARRLGRCLVETDDMITAKEGMSIPEIFAAKGEAYFRAAEEGALGLLALKGGDEVIATGGGLPCREGRPAALRALGTVVWLSGDFDVLYRRALAAGERPMLADRSRGDVQALYQSRVPFYAQADIAVDTTALGPDQVAAEILKALRARERTASGRTAR
jgi:shikimate kinase